MTGRRRPVGLTSAAAVEPDNRRCSSTRVPGGCCWLRLKLSGVCQAISTNRL